MLTLLSISLVILGFFLTSIGMRMDWDLGYPKTGMKLMIAGILSAFIGSGIATYNIASIFGWEQALSTVGILISPVVIVFIIGFIIVKLMNREKRIKDKKGHIRHTQKENK